MADNEKLIVVQKTANQRFRTKRIWQYDVGHELRFDGFNLPDIFQVHFAHSPTGDSRTQIGQDGVCEIPAEYTQNSGTAYAWVYVAETDTGLTKYAIEIPVEARGAITNQEPTPAEQSVIDQTIAAANRAVEKAEDAQEAAETAQAGAESARDDAVSAATQAANSATDANASREAADVSATNAGVSERNAKASETAAASSASEAAGYAQDISGAVSTAQAAAQTAMTKATEASESASTAAQKAQEAASSAGSASQSATAANTAKTAAETTKNDAVNAKNDAQTAATNAASSATSASGSATAASQSATAAAQSATDATVAMKNKAPAIVQTASGDIASFDNGADGMPVKAMTVQIEPVQSGTGDPSPDNVRPITGWTGCNISHSGADTSEPTVYPIAFPSSAGTVYGGTLDPIEGVVRVDRAMVTYDGSSDENWTRNSLNEYYIQNNDVAKLPNYIGSILCDKLTTYRVASLLTSGFQYGISAYVPDGYPGQNWIYVYLTASSPTDVTEFKGWLSENPITVCYELAEPFTIPVDPVQITTLLGANRIWADTGSVSVDYCADTKTYVDGSADDKQDKPASTGTAGQVLGLDENLDPVWVNQSGGVQDVQVNGTSVVTDGVANVPIATDSAVGVGAAGSGLTMSSGNAFTVNKASDAHIKAGGQLYRPIVPANQHQSTFYGLAKSAGDSTQSASSNAVGVYTDAAKVAIQKMLGLYQAPWELIREDTGTNAESANVEIAVDGNGQAFELTDVYIEFWLPQQETDARVGAYGRMDFYYSDNGYFSTYSGAKTQEANTYPYGTFALLKNDNGAIYKVNGTYNTMGTDRVATSATGKVNENRSLLILNTNNYPFVKVVANAITGTYQYRLYGKRKWN